MDIKSFKGGYDRNFCYVVSDNGIGVVIDPFEPVNDILEYCAKEDIELKGILITHGHFDHVDGVESLEDNRIHRLPQESTRIGKIDVEVIPVPGHTEDSVCYLIDGNLFTGDTLFVGKIGGTYSEDGARQQWQSLRKLMELPPQTKIWPGHDYGTTPTSTIARETKENPFITAKDFQEFLYIKNNWHAYKQEHGLK